MFCYSLQLCIVSIALRLKLWVVSAMRLFVISIRRFIINAPSHKPMPFYIIAIPMASSIIRLFFMCVLLAFFTTAVLRHPLPRSRNPKGPLRGSGPNRSTVPPKLRPKHQTCIYSNIGDSFLVSLRRYTTFVDITK